MERVEFFEEYAIFKKNSAKLCGTDAFENLMRSTPARLKEDLERSRPMLRFLHAGDLHLDSPLAAFPPRVAARRRERQFAALEQLFADALAKGAALMCIPVCSSHSKETPGPDSSVRPKMS